MKTPVLRHLLTFMLATTLLSPLYACGDDRRKECVAKCDHEGEECLKRHDRDCAERTHKCAEECKK